MSKIKVGEHIKIIPGFPFNSALFNNDGDGLPLIRIRDLLTSKIETYYRGEFPKEYLIEEGDILIGMDGDFHIVKWKNKTKALLNQRIMKVAQKDGAAINIEYFYYFLFPFLSDVWEKTTATTVKHLSTYDVSEAEVEFPKFEVQTKIARILSTADTVIEKTQAAIAKYKAIKQGMLQDLFTRGIDLNTKKLRPRYQDAPGLYKESKLGWIPREWDEIPLEELTTQIGDGIHTTPKYSQNTHFYFINGNNLVNGEIQIGSALCVNEEEFEKYFKKLDERTILYSINGTIGNIAFYKNEQVIIGKSVCYISCKQNVNLDYIYFLLQTFQVSKFYELELTASTIRNLSLASVRSTPITIPKDEAEQNLIAERIKAINNKLQTEQTYLQKMQSLKKGLMDDLLSGKKQVKVNEELVKQNEN